MDRDRIEGTLKEADAKLTGDEEREKEGRAQESLGKAKDSVDGAYESGKDAADDAWEATKDVADSAKDQVDKRV